MEDQHEVNKRPIENLHSMKDRKKIFYGRKTSIRSCMDMEGRLPQVILWMEDLQKSYIYCRPVFHDLKTSESSAIGRQLLKVLLDIENLKKVFYG